MMCAALLLGAVFKAPGLDAWFGTFQGPPLFFFVVVGYKGGEIYWLAIHSNQANLIVGGLRHRRHQQTRQAPLFQEVPSTRTKTSRGVEPLHPLVSNLFHSKHSL
jgi:hypothetical protein